MKEYTVWNIWSIHARVFMCAYQDNALFQPDMYVYCTTLRTNAVWHEFQQQNTQKPEALHFLWMHGHLCKQISRTKGSYDSMNRFFGAASVPSYLNRRSALFLRNAFARFNCQNAAIRMKWPWNWKQLLYGPRLCKLLCLFLLCLVKLYIYILSRFL